MTIAVLEFSDARSSDSVSPFILDYVMDGYRSKVQRVLQTSGALDLW